MKMIISVVLSILIFSCASTDVKDIPNEIKEYDMFLDCYYDCKVAVIRILKASNYSKEQVEEADVSGSCVDICTYITNKIKENPSE